MSFNYESPIEIIMKSTKTHQEGEIMNIIQGYGIIVDKDELISALNYDRRQYEQGYIDGCNDHSKSVLIERYDKIVRELLILRDAWSAYDHEFCMQCKMEVVDIVIGMINRMKQQEDNDVC